jgi:hypothetical protein
MSNADKFWRYAEEAMISAQQSKSEREKRTLMDLARTWAQAAVQSETTAVLNDCPPEARAVHGRLSCEPPT